MISSDFLKDGYALNTRLIHLQADGLSNADSLIQPPFNSNCLNWVIGHIVQGRCTVLELLGQETVMTEEQRDRYKRGSDPIKGEEAGIMTLAALLAALDESQTRIDAALDSITEAELAVVVEDEATLAHRLYGQYFHDTYHTGQTDLLRQVAGTNDVVIP